MKIKYIPYLQFLVREKGGSTSWSKGCYNKKLGYFIKYKFEKKMSDFFLFINNIKFIKNLFYKSFMLKFFFYVLNEHKLSAIHFKIFYYSQRNKYLLKLYKKFISSYSN